VYPEREKLDEEVEPVGFEEGIDVCFLASIFFFCSSVFLCLAIKKLGYSIDTFAVKRLR